MPALHNHNPHPLLLAALLAACAQSPTANQPAPSTEPTNQPVATEREVPQVPTVTPADACVPAEEIYFDTFRGGSIRFSNATQSEILNLRDVIPPIDNPKYEPASGGDWMQPDNLVLGYTDGDEVYAYPLKILNFHEIVNENINGKAVLISYCPLCLSSLVFSRKLNGQVLTFGNTSALYNSDMVMYDHQTGSYWHQVGGEAIVGSLCEQRLQLLPSLTSTWEAWKQLHPDTLVLSLDTGFQRPYQQDSFSGYANLLDSGRFAFPVSQAGNDPRLAASDIILAVEANAARRGYSLTALGDAVVHDNLAEQNIVVFSSAAGPSGAAYFPLAGDQQLTFVLDNGQYIDEQTGTVWNLAGEALEGSLAGTLLEQVPARYTFWFAIVATYPDIELYSP